MKKRLYAKPSAKITPRCTQRSIPHTARRTIHYAQTPAVSLPSQSRILPKDAQHAQTPHPLRRRFALFFTARKTKSTLLKSLTLPQRKLILYALCALGGICVLVFCVRLLTAPPQAADAFPYPTYALLKEIPAVKDSVYAHAQTTDSKGRTKIQIDIARVSYTKFKTYTNTLKENGFADPYSPMLVPKNSKTLKYQYTIYNAYRTSDENETNQGIWLRVYWYADAYRERENTEISLRLIITNYAP